MVTKNKKSLGPLMMMAALFIFCFLSPICALSPAKEQSSREDKITAEIEESRQLESSESGRQADTLAAETAPKLPPGYLPPVTDWQAERVLLLGDSLSVGLGPDLARSLRDKKVGAFRNIGVGGTMINHWAWPGNFRHARDLERALEEFRPTIVLVCLGTNDEAFRGTTDHAGRPMKKPYGPSFSVAHLRENSLAEITKKLEHIPRRVWLIPPITPRWRPDTLFRDNLKSWGGGYLETEPLHLPKQADRLHISDRGNRIWANAIIEYLKNGFLQ